MIRPLLLLGCLALAGCTIKVNNVRVDPAKIDGHVATTLRCAYRLESVVDERPSGDRAGALGTNLLTLDNVPDTVRSHLRNAGFADSGGEGTAISLEIMRLYINQNLYTKLPTVVYRVTAGEGQPFLIRSQLASMQWSSSEESVYEGYSAAMRDANGRLIDELNARCR